MMRSSYIVTVCIALLLASSAMVILSLPGTVSVEETTTTTRAAHAPIRIDSDLDFTVANGVSSGDGSVVDPYVIEGLEIDGTGYGFCIFIGNTTKHFRIDKCTLNNATGNPGTYYKNATVHLRNAQNGIVVNTTCKDSAGADVFTNSDITLLNCSFNHSLLDALGSAVITVRYYHDFYFYDLGTNTFDLGGVTDVITNFQNNASLWLFQGVSDQEGYIHWAILTAYTYDTVGFDYSNNNHTIHGVKNGYDDTILDFNASKDNFRIEVMMEDSTKPAIYDVTTDISENITKENPCHVQGTIYDPNLVHKGIVYCDYLSQDIQFDNFRTLAYFDDTHPSDPTTCEDVAGNRTFLNHTWNATINNGGYITDGPKELYLSGGNATGSQGEELLTFSVAYYNNKSELTPIDATIQFHTNGTLYGLVDENASVFHPANNLDPTGKVRADIQILRFNLGETELFDHIDTFSDEIFDIVDIALEPDTKVPSGNYCAFIYGGDRGDNGHGNSTLITVDNTAPENVNLQISPLFSASSTGGFVTLSATSTSPDLARVDFHRSFDLVNWTLWHTDDTPLDGFVYSFDSTLQNDWEGVIRIEMFDKWNNSVLSPPQPIEIDNTVPDITFFDLGNTHLRDKVTLRINTTAADVQWCSFHYSMDGTIWTFLGNDTNGADNWTTELDTTYFSDGDAFIRAEVMDEAHNSNSTTLGITIDSVSPIIFEVWPEEETWLPLGTQEIEVKFTDLHRDKVLFFRSLDNSDWTLVKEDTDLADGWTWNLTVQENDPLGADDKVYLKIIVFDKAGNNDTRYTWVRFDYVAPAMRIESPSTGSRVKIGYIMPITLNSSDADSGLSKVSVDVRGPKNITIYDSKPFQKTFSTEWDTDVFPPGDYTITATATDVAGLSNTTSTTVEVYDPIIPDTTPPEVILSVPDDGSINVALDTDVIIEFSEEMADPGPGIIVSVTPSVTFTIAWNDTYTFFTMDFAEDLAENTTYSVTVLGASLVDVAGNQMLANYPFVFTTKIVYPMADIDTDYDGIDDKWEIRYFGDLTHGADEDYDGDSYTNYEEFLVNTDPKDPEDYPGHVVDDDDIEDVDDDIVDNKFGIWVVAGIVLAVAFVWGVFGHIIYMNMQEGANEEE